MILLFRLFQSSPAINCGCHYRQIIQSQRCRMFQSSPAINCGCHHQAIDCLGRHGCFNPHPRSTAGVTQFLHTPHSRKCHVSILTRDQLRVSHHDHHQITIHTCSFNPHPRSTAGVTAAHVYPCIVRGVSILTRDQLRVSRPEKEF